MEITAQQVEQAMKNIFKDEPHRGEKRYWFTDKDAADTVSESLKHLNDEGLGLIYGPFVNIDHVSDPPHRWWEVSYK
jgi:hypothetical protein